MADQVSKNLALRAIGISAFRHYGRMYNEDPSKLDIVLDMKYMVELHGRSCTVTVYDFSESGPRPANIPADRLYESDLHKAAENEVLEKAEVLEKRFGVVVKDKSKF